MEPVGILFVVAVLFAFLQHTRPAIAGNQAVFLLLNVAFICMVMTVPAMAYLSLFLFFNYVLSIAACKWRNCHIAVFIVSAISIFCVFKRYDILPLQPLYAHIPDILGLSYIIFRTLNVLFDCRGTGRLPNPLSYLNYCLSLFTFLSGPIQRYRAFNEDMERRKQFRLEEKLAAPALTRCMNGVIKTVLLAPVMQTLQTFFMSIQVPLLKPVTHGDIPAAPHGVLSSPGDLASPLGFGLAALSYLVFLYFNFSGYTDIAIGLGNLAGFRLPENFDRPFTATNFIDFWKRWHMSLSLWFRDYCFTPVLKYIVKAGVKQPAIATLPAYFISFALLGIWHGRTWPFILCGLMLAAGATINHVYRTILSPMSADARRRLAENRLYSAFSSAVTFMYISVAIVGFWLTGPALGSLWHSFSLREASLSFGLIAIGLGLMIYLIRLLLQIKTFEEVVVGSMEEFFEGESAFLIAFKMFMFLVWFFSLSTHLPELTYQEF